MVALLIQVNKEEDEKVNYYSAKWEISKHDTVRRMIEEFIPLKNYDNDDDNIDEENIEEEM